MKASYLALWSCLVLGACASNSPPPAKLDDKIAAALQEAAVTKPLAPSQAQIERMQEALLPQLKLEMPPSSQRLMEPRFDLVVSGAPAAQVFNSIVSGTRYSMLVHPDVTGAISVSLKDVTVQEALDSIRQLYGYEFKVDGTRIFIQPAGLQTRVFQVNYLIGARQGRSDMRVSTRQTSSQQGTLIGTAASAPATGGLTQQQQPPSLTPNGAGALGSGGGSISNDASQMSTVQLTDFWAELSVSLRALIGSADGRNIVISPQSGIVVVRAMPNELRGVEDFLKAMQVSVERQVMLEAKIIDVTLNDGYQAGVNWAAFPTSGLAAGFTSGNFDQTIDSAGNITPSASLTTSNNSALRSSSFAGQPGARAIGALGVGIATAANPAAGVFGLALQTSNFAALLQFLETQGNVQVLSSPRVATLNNQKAVIKVGIDEPFSGQAPGQTATATVAGTTPTNTTSSVFSGISLDILPQIDSNGNITLHVHPVVSQVERIRISSGSGVGTVEAPRVDISESDTVVRTTDGSIIALGGLMRVAINDSRGGVPGLSEVPGIGGAFRNAARGSVKRELIILIKPTVLQSEADRSQELRQAGDRILDMFPAAAGESR